MTDDPLIITCAIVGAELTRDDTPHLPLTPEELALSAKEAVHAGATIIHIHVRDEKGKPTQRVDIFEEVSEKIRKDSDCIIQYSTGGAAGTLPCERNAPLNLRPDMATLSMGTMNFGSGIFENNEETIRTLSKTMQKKNILPELEIFDLGMFDSIERYLKKDYIPKKFHLDFVLGVPGGMGGELKNLLFLVDQLKAGQTWTVAGIGRFQLPLAVHAIAMGGHVRVGLEDNIYFRKGELVKTNAQLVKRIVNIAQEMDRPVATVDEARSILGLLG